jgi:hypothetical protein
VAVDDANGGHDDEIVAIEADRRQAMAREQARRRTATSGSSSTPRRCKRVTAREQR